MKSISRSLAALLTVAFVTGLWSVGAIAEQAAQQPQAQQPAPPPTPQQRVAMLKEWLKASQAQLRAYEWIETITVSKDGKVQSHKQNSCYYSAEGKLQKVPLGDDHPEKSKGFSFMPPPMRLLKAIGKHEKKELVAYMKKAQALVESYIPPHPEKIQHSINAGKMSINIIEPGHRVRLDFKDYLKPGDTLGVDIEIPTNRLLGISVSSYLDDAKDTVTLNAGMGVLPDGTIYTAHTTLAAAAKGVTVVIDNTGHRRVKH